MIRVVLAALAATALLTGCRAAEVRPADPPPGALVEHELAELESAIEGIERQVDADSG